MPFKSKAQQRWMFAAANRGELPAKTPHEWAKHTPDMKALPEKVRKKKATDCCQDSGRGSLVKPGPEAIRKMAFRILAKASQRLPEKSAQVCRQLALAIGHGSSLSDALSQCQLPNESRVKVARFLLNAVKQAAAQPR